MFAVAQLVLDVFQLLLEEILLLLLVDFAVCALLDLFAETKQLNLTVENAQQGVGALHKAVFEQQEGFFFRVDREVRGHEVREKHRIGDVLHGQLGFHAEKLAEFDVLQRSGAKLFAEGHKFTVVVARKVFGQRSHGRNNKRFLAGEALIEAHTAVGLDDRRRFLVGKFDHTEEFRQRSDGIEVFKLGVFHFRVHLRHHGEVGFVVGQAADVLDQRHRTFAADGDGGDNTREKHQVAQRQNGKFPIAAVCEEVADVTVEVGDEREGIIGS